MDVNELTELFRQLGARDPEGWARSQLNEGIPQLARFVLLKQLWREVVAEEPPQWIQAQVESAQAHGGGAFAGAGHAITKLRARGATDAELSDLVRGMQAQLLFSVCEVLDDPGDLPPELADISWALFRIDADGSAREPLADLHESVLSLDPTGREMRPR